MTSILIVRPESDGVERVLSSWADRIRQKINWSSEDLLYVAVTDISGAAVDRPGVEAAARSADLLLFFGHGSPSSLGNPAVLDLANADKTGTGIYLVAACSAATDLGPALVKQGVRAFIGYHDLLVVVTARPDPLGTAHKKGVLALLEGRTTSEATQEISNEYRRIREKYINSTAPNAALTWLAAHGNMNTLRLVGSGAATL